MFKIETYKKTCRLISCWSVSAQLSQSIVCVRARVFSSCRKINEKKTVTIYYSFSIEFSLASNKIKQSTKWIIYYVIGKWTREKAIDFESRTKKAIHFINGKSQCCFQCTKQPNKWPWGILFQHHEIHTAQTTQRHMSEVNAVCRRLLKSLIMAYCEKHLLLDRKLRNLFSTIFYLFESGNGICYNLTREREKEKSKMRILLIFISSFVLTHYYFKLLHSNCMAR